MSICCFRSACLLEENETLNSVAVRFFINSALPWRQSCQIHLLVFALFQVCWCSLLFCGWFFFHGFGKTELEFVYRGRGREAAASAGRVTSKCSLPICFWQWECDCSSKICFFHSLDFPWNENLLVGSKHTDLWLCTEIHCSFPISWSGRSNCGLFSIQMTLLVIFLELCSSVECLGVVCTGSVSHLPDLDAFHSWL